MHGRCCASAMALASSARPVATLARLHATPRRVAAPCPRKRAAGRTLQAAAIDVETAEAQATSIKALTNFQFVCPICNQTEFNLLRLPDKPQPLTCPRCARSFNSDDAFVDLTLTSGVKPQVYEQRQWLGTEQFRNPTVSFVYERGWRQGFAWAGFPGVDQEFDLAMDYLKPAYGEVLVDMSCGTGLFSRKFLKSGRFSGVVAADYSESMLRQSKTFFRQEGVLSSETPVMLLRADVARLPFATGSVAAIHAGAALHCWPNPQAALAEISRVLRPGGVFVASTFLVPTAPLGQLLGSDDLVRPLNQLASARSRGAFRYWEEAEIVDLCSAVGLQDFTRHRNFQFIMFAATKPGSFV